MKSRRASATLFVAACILQLAFAAAASADFGLAGHFGESGQGAGQFNTARAIAVNETGAGSGAESGDLYILDGGFEQRINQFHRDGTFVRTWGWGVLDGADEFQICTGECHGAVLPSAEGAPGAIQFASGLAVDQSTGNVYVADGSNVRVDIFGSDGTFQGAFGFGVISGASTFEFCTTVCQIGVEGAAAGQLDDPSYVAVDPASGAIYVADDGSVRVDKFSLTLNGSSEVTGATFVNAFGWNVAGTGDPGDTAPVNHFETCTTVCLAGANGSELGQFGQFQPASIAVDSAGVLYAADDSPGGKAQSFTPSGGSYTPAVFAPAITAPRHVAVGAGDHVFLTKSFPFGATESCPNGSPSLSEYRIAELNSAGVLQDPDMGLTCGRVQTFFGLAANKATGELYVPVNDYEGPFEERVTGVRILTDSQLPSVTIDEITPTTAGAVIDGTINPNGPPASIPNAVTTSYQLQYKLSSSSEWTSFGSPIDIGAGFTPVPVTVNLGGLEGNTPYDIRIAATRPLGLPTSFSTPENFTTSPVPPSIESFSSSDVTASSADLHGLVNPHGADTSIHFEYGPTPSYGLETSEEDIGSALTAQPVQAHIEDLEHVVYHFRLVASNPTGTTRSPDQTFTFYPPQCPNATVRQQTGSQYLPDCRAYELVSPEFAGNVVLVGLEFPAPYATSPARFIFGGIQGAVAGGFDTQSANVADKYVASRSNTGWVTKYVGLRGSEVLQSNGIYPSITLDRFMDFKANLDSGPYVWDYNGNPMGRWPSSLTTIPEADTGEQSAWQPSPDFSHLGFSSSKFAFDPAGEGLTTAPGSAYDYNSATNAVTIISKTPAGTDIPSEPTNSSTTDFIRFPGSPSGNYPARINPSVSVDGSHVLMGTRRTEFGTRAHLYMRVDDSVTYDVSQGRTVNYVGMTKDASEVFFTSDEPLATTSNQDTDTSTDLYMWSEDTDSLTRLSVGSGGAGDTDACVAAWTAKCGIKPVSGGAISDYPVSNQSGAILFYSPELLDGPANGLEGAQNVYLYHDGQAQFVAQLSASGANPLTRVQISPDGEHAAFITTSRLSSYDSQGFAEMYSYDAVGRELRCVSCDPTGAPPTTNVRGSTSGLFMSDDGRTFWSTSDALVPIDTNRLTDVYEFVEGRPQLISSGTADLDTSFEGRTDAGLSGVSADGINVYFIAFDSLVVQDKNGPYPKFYDARTNGGFPPPPIELPCVAADECHGDTNPAPPAPRVVSNGDLGTGGNVAAKKSRKAKRNAKRRNRQRAHRLRAARRHHRGGRG